MSMVDVIEQIEKLPHDREFCCHKCGRRNTASVLSIHVDCEQCGTSHKLRGYASIGSEIEDVIDAVLQWMGSGAALEAVMRRKQEIDRHSELE